MNKKINSIQRTLILKNTFSYQIEDIPKTPSSTKQPTNQRNQIEKDYLIYQSLKEINKIVINAPIRVNTPNVLTMAGIYRREQELQKTRDTKRNKEQEFIIKKKDMLRLLLQDNNLQLQKDIKNLEILSQSASQQFCNQINVYNRNYSNFLCKEKTMEDLKQTNKQDLQISVRRLSAPIGNQQQQKRLKTEKDINSDQKDNIISGSKVLLGVNDRLMKMKNKLFVVNENIEFIRAVKRGDEIEVMELLKQDPQLIHSRDELNLSCLHWAAKRNSQQMMKMLLDYGASTDCRDIQDRTPRDIALLFQNTKMARFIQNHDEYSKKDQFVIVQV